MGDTHADTELFDVTPQNITMHLKAIYDSGEMDRDATSTEFLLVLKRV